jgi:hypothetical protein
MQDLVESKICSYSSDKGWFELLPACSTPCKKRNQKHWPQVRCDFEERLTYEQVWIDQPLEEFIDELLDKHFVWVGISFGKVISLPWVLFSLVDYQTHVYPKIKGNMAWWTPIKVSPSEIVLKPSEQHPEYIRMEEEIDRMYTSYVRKEQMKYVITAMYRRDK